MLLDVTRSGGMTAVRPAAVDKTYVRRSGPLQSPDLVDRAGLASFGVVVGAGLMWLVHDVLPDDSFITLAYARELGMHGLWGMVPGVVSNTATSALTVLMLGGLTAVVRDPVAACGLLLAACFAAVAVWTRRIAADRGLPPVATSVATVVVLALNPLLVSSVGLESMLAVTLFVAGARYRGSWLTGSVAGLLVLTRPDLAPAAGVVVMFAGRAWWRAGLAATAIVVPWLLISWRFLGSFVPDTVIIKGADSWGGFSAWNSLVLLAEHYPAAVALAVAPVAVAAMTAPFWWRWRAALLIGSAGLAHYLTMAALHPAPFHWYMSPSLGAATVVAVLGAALALQERVTRSVRTAPVLALVLITMLSIGLDLRHGMPRTGFVPISTNWASAAQYRAAAAWIPDGATVTSPGEVGTLAYYAGERGARVMDGFSDPGYLREKVDEKRAASVLWRVDFRYWGEPAPRPVDYVTGVTQDMSRIGAPMFGSWGGRWQKFVLGRPAP
jgi:hypothetical protein